MITYDVLLKIQSCKLHNSKYMITSTQITNTEIFAFIAVLVFNLMCRKVLFINKQDKRNCEKVSYFLRKEQISRVNSAKFYIVGMWKFQDTLETRKRSFINAFSIWFFKWLYLYSNCQKPFLQCILLLQLASINVFLSHVKTGRHYFL